MNYESFYATKVAIGTPPYDALLLMDTGSDETWVQGEGCTKCFDLISGNFKYKESRTYTMESCDNPFCDPRICIENVCHYGLLYDDGDHTTGYLSSETFKFPSEKEDKIYTDVIFGVGLENPKEPFMKDENTIGGIFGLGCGPRSILTQLEDETQLRFSYCLFDLTSGRDSYTYLHFGEDAQIIENEQAVVQETSLLPDQNQYHVQVLDNIYCMLIKPTSEQGVNVLGAVQQQDYRFLFDVIEGVMA
ncbi:aspartic proteinase nepenthesin-2 [Quercus suber]|uniref:Aspartic proteinase nepenthesin-2 n=1 Tax=Quercus suber TaxID=58331 RepID=A0AAW0JTU4_QUESU